MKTKLGEIKSTNDFFIVQEVITRAQGTNGFGSVMEERWECKLCGEELRGVSFRGACHSGMIFIEQLGKEHIEFHLLIKNLKL